MAGIPRWGRILRWESRLRCFRLNFSYGGVEKCYGRKADFSEMAEKGNPEIVAGWSRSDQRRGGWGGKTRKNWDLPIDRVGVGGGFVGKSRR
jgi:hypothetical protein